MKYKNLFLIFTIGLSITLFYLQKFYHDTNLNINFIVSSKISLNIALLIFALILHLTAHLIRAYKSNLLINPIRNVNTSFTFKILTISFLFNAILPFRIGELIRAHLLGKHLYISRSVMFLTILFERAIDGFIICILGISLSYLAFYNFDIYINEIHNLLLFVLTISTGILIFILCLYTQNKFLIKTTRQISNIFNCKIKNKLRFIVWSCIYGTNIVFKKINLKKYFFLSILMWACYLSSVIVLIKSLSINLNLVKELLISISAYLSVSFPSGPAYIGTYHYFFSEILKGIIQNHDEILFISIVTWCLLIIPIALTGLIFLFEKNSLKKNSILSFFNPKQEIQALSNIEYLNKLYRHKDISKEFNSFLDEYFNEAEISHELNKHEINGNMKLIKTLKGGSNAFTALIISNNLTCVRKIALIQHANKLKSQYNWILQKQHLKEIPKIIDMKNDNKSIYIDIEYKEKLIPFFDYIHSNDISKSKFLLEKIINFVTKYIHMVPVQTKSLENINFYIEEKILKKIYDTSLLSNDLSKIISYPEITVNGILYDNYEKILTKISTDKEIMAQLSIQNKTDLHGDLTIDNILVSDEEFALLDPNDENYIADPIVDFAKLYQSLNSGYEFLCLLNNAAFNDNIINFEESISSKYRELFKFLHELLGVLLPRERLKLIKFHEAVHYCRMLTYRARINPKTLLVFYATAIKLFNEFYNEFKKI